MNGAEDEEDEGQEKEGVDEGMNLLGEGAIWKEGGGGGVLSLFASLTIHVPSSLPTVCRR